MSTPQPAYEVSSHKKAFAMFCVVFLAFMYKEMVWDVFFQIGDSNPARSSSAEQASADKPAPGQEMPKAPTPAAAPASPVTTAPLASADAVADGVITDALIDQQGYVQVLTEDLIVKISNLGARAKSIKLVKHKQEVGVADSHLEMVSHVESIELPFGVYTGSLDDSAIVYRLVSEAGGEFSVAGSQSKTLRFEGSFPDGRTIAKEFTFHGGGFFVDVKVSLSAAPADGSKLELAWTQFEPESDKSMLDPYSISQFTWFDGEKASREPIANIESGVKELGNVKWVSVGDKYFVDVVMTTAQAARARIVSEGQAMSTRVTGDATQGSFRVFVGPKSYRLLDRLGNGLERNIDFGWTGFVAAPLLFLLNVFYDLLGNYGLAIVALTILIKFLLYPLTVTSFRQMKAMQDIAPEVKKLRETVKDKQQQQLELMALYKKKGVNPLGGCLPMLAQMPIFIGLYSALILAIELRHAPFALWVTDLSAAERMPLFGMGVPVMVILMVISMLVQQWLTPSSVDPAQKKMMMIMPLVFGFMFMGFPAGLTLYWLINNLISIAQQKAMHSDDPKAPMKYSLATAAGVFGFFSLIVAIG